ncbi:MAG: hypothetical protein JW874_07840 [Spirochaetales bacterium]|nr:hypothetical protein [Spirochaetales bacterium]
MKKLTLSAVLLALLAVVAGAQEAVLSKHDIDLFISTFPAINADLAELDMGISTDNDHMNIAPALTMAAKNKSIFTGRGWDEHYLVKVSLILQGLYLLTLEEQMLASSPEIRQALDELDATPVSPYFTLETKNQTREMILMSISAMNKALYEQMDGIAASDLELLRARKTELMEVLDQNN